MGCTGTNKNRYNCYNEDPTPMTLNCFKSSFQQTPRPWSVYAALEHTTSQNGKKVNNQLHLTD